MAQWVKKLARVSAAAAATAAVTQMGAWTASRRAGRVNVVDVAWGPGLAGIAAVSALLGDGDRLRRRLLVSAVTPWGTRLALHVFRSSAGLAPVPSVRNQVITAGDRTVHHPFPPDAATR